MDRKVEVSVIMPAYNAASYIGEAISSILRQTWRDFELIIIDDGSKDATQSVVRSFQDPRIKILINETNKGLVFSLNRGMNSASGTFIARMDADDISHSRRLEKQVAFLKTHPEVGMCGTFAQQFGEGSTGMLPPTEDGKIRNQMLFDCPFVHPSIMMRRDIWLKYDLFYPESGAEDYALWQKIACVTKLANLPEILFSYRVHAQQLTQASENRVFNGAMEVRYKEWEKEVRFTLSEAQKRSLEGYFLGDASRIDLACLTELFSDLLCRKSGDEKLWFKQKIYDRLVPLLKGPQNKKQFKDLVRCAFKLVPVIGFWRSRRYFFRHMKVGRF